MTAGSVTLIIIHCWNSATKCDTRLNEFLQREQTRLRILQLVDERIECEVTEEFPAGFPVWKKVPGKAGPVAAIIDGGTCEECRVTRRARYLNHVHVTPVDPQVHLDTHADLQTLSVRWRGL